MNIGIVSYGSYIPRLRLARGEYQKAWGSCAADIKEKAVMDYDEDTLTMGVEAAREALRTRNPGDVGILALASTSFPYEEKALSGTVAAMLDLPERLFCSEHGQSMRAGTEAILTAAGLLRYDAYREALVIASDAPAAHPRDTIEHGLGAGAAAFILGKTDQIAEIEYFCSYVSESMGERFRIKGNSLLTDIGVKGFTSLPYSRLISLGVRDVLKALNRSPSDYRYVVMQETDGRTPRSLAQKLGFQEEQVLPGLLYTRIGDTGTGSVLLSLAALLDEAQQGDRILLASYGSGAGSQAMSLRVNCAAGKNGRRTLKGKLENSKAIDYVHYLKLKRQIL